MNKRIILVNKRRTHTRRHIHDKQQDKHKTTHVDNTAETGNGDNSTRKRIILRTQRIIHHK